MGRSRKTSLETMPIPTDIFQEIPIRRLIKQHGAAAMATYIFMLSDLYQHGYYITVDDDLILRCCEATALSEQLVTQVIDAAVCLEIFDADIYREHHVLTSADIQNRYLKAHTQSRRIARLDLYALVDDTPKRRLSLKPAKKPQVGFAAAEAKSDSMVIIDSSPIVIPVDRRPVQGGVAEEGRMMKAEIAWRETIASNHALGSLEELDRYIDAFVNECLCSSKTHPSYPEAKAHFHNWLRTRRTAELKELANINTNKKNGNRTTAPVNPRRGNLQQAQTAEKWELKQAF